MHVHVLFQPTPVFANCGGYTQHPLATLQTRLEAPPLHTHNWTISPSLINIWTYSITSYIIPRKVRWVPGGWGLLAVEEGYQRFDGREILKIGRHEVTISFPREVQLPRTEH